MLVLMLLYVLCTFAYNIGWGLAFNPIHLHLSAHEWYIIVQIM